jgi:hypothetical protein
VSSKIEVNHLKAGLRARQELIGNQPFYYVLDAADGCKKFSEEAKAWVSVNPESGEVRIADIVLVKSFLSKMEVILYNFFFKPIRKLKAVNSTDAAIEYIDSIRPSKH